MNLISSIKFMICDFFRKYVLCCYSAASTYTCPVSYLTMITCIPFSMNSPLTETASYTLPSTFTLPDGRSTVDATPVLPTRLSASSYTPT